MAENTAATATADSEEVSPGSEIGAYFQQEAEISLTAEVSTATITTASVGNTNDAVVHRNTNNNTQETVVVVHASIVDSNSQNDEEETEEVGVNCSCYKNTSRTNFLYFALIVVVLAAIITTGLAIRSAGGQNMRPQESEKYDTDMKSSIVDREGIREWLIESLAPLSGIGVFSATGPESSKDRIAALEWLVEDMAKKLDGASGGGKGQLSFGGSHWNFKNEAKARQRYVLALLYTSTNGDDWFDKLFFLTHDMHECDWSSVANQDDDRRVFLDSDYVIKGVICNQENKVVQLRMWWNNMAGTIPHELSELDSLEVLNMGGGSIAGTIPDSLSKLTNLEWMLFHDNCLTGTIPAYLGGELSASPASDEEIDDSTPPSPDLLSSLTILSLYNNMNLKGSLNGFCNGTDLVDGFITLAGDCGCPMDVEGSDDLSGAFNVDCDCCLCSDPQTFDLCDLQQNSWKSHLLDEFTPNGYPKSFDRATCTLSDKSREWIRTECPCLLPMYEGPFLHACTTDCAQEGAFSSHNFGGTEPSSGNGNRGTSSSKPNKLR
jgi:hypothetical protein